MKIVIATLLLLSSFKSYSQQGFQLGLEASPTWNVVVQKQLSSGLRAYQSGYGFNVGVPIKWWALESLALHTGLNFEYAAFDNRFNNTLVSSVRYGSIHLPLMLNYPLGGGWYADFGGGLKYQVFNQSWAGGIGVDISGITNQFQPYGGVGVSTLVERDKGVFELGAQGRFHFISLLSETHPNVDVFTERILSFDLVLRYYLLNR